RLAARAADRRWLTVDANDAAAQAVTVRRLGLSAANFWRAGSAGRLTSGAPASVLVRRERRTARLHVAEPSRTGEPFELTWDRPVREVVSADKGLEVLGAGRRLRLRVTPGTAGASLGCTVRLR
ncbi:polysaccharide lyase beta-sandwich domain-containing protein, partial [Streptomyces nanshensis]